MSESSSSRNEEPYPSEGSGVESLVLANKFRLTRQLGVHDEELVYDGLHLATERRVRIHLLDRSESPKSPLVERMRRAARAAGRVPHPNVLGVVDSGLDPQGRPFLVYEFFGSTSLADFVRERGALPLEDAARLICQLLDGLSALHRGGVVHRAVSPENVLVERVGDELRAKLTGFGFAVVQGKFDDPPALPRGFSRYLAPEARRHAHASGPALDIFAVGVLMRFLLSGDAASTAALDPRAERAILRACAEDPEERFAEAEHFLGAVALLLPEAGGGDVLAAEPDPLLADLRYLQQRQERDSAAAVDDGGRMELYPVLMMVEAVYARLGADGWKKLCRALPDVERLLPGAGFGEQLRRDGVSAQLVGELLRVAGQLAAEGDVAWLVDIGEALVTRGLSRFCPRLPAQLTPDGLVDCLGQIWGCLARQGEVSVLERSPVGARVAVRAQTTPRFETCAVLSGLLRGQMRRISDDFRIGVLACQALGDPADIFVLNFRPGP